MSLGGDLSIDVNRYWEYAPRAKWDSIRESLVLLEERIHDSPSWSDYQSTYNSGYVSVSFWKNHIASPDLKLSANDAAKVVATTRDLFFVYKDNPRQFLAEIMLRREINMFYVVRWRPTVSAWPERLPFLFDSLRNPKLNIYLYGRDIKPSLVRQVRDSLRRLSNTINAEGPPTGFINQDTYSHEQVKLIVQGPSMTLDGKLRITRRDMINVVDNAYELYTDNGPREFAAQIFGPHSILGKVFFLFTDLDDGRGVKSIARA
ncbi:MAG: hypothetical protein L6R41_000914 [Letrouitia leprolyta]|nr:MAG: hypothetical protein L6R41_000914 [Letrouitia leprolyta]